MFTYSWSTILKGIQEPIKPLRHAGRSQRDLKRYLLKFQKTLTILKEIQEGDLKRYLLKKKLRVTGRVYIQGVFFKWYPPKKLKYGKPGLGESTLT